MQKKYACVRYLHTRVTVYHPCKIDLRHSKALHSCGACSFLQGGLPCSAIHYGMCRALTVPVSPTDPHSSNSPTPVSLSRRRPVLVQTTTTSSNRPAALPAGPPHVNNINNNNNNNNTVSTQTPKPVWTSTQHPKPVLVQQVSKSGRLSPPPSVPKAGGGVPIGNSRPSPHHHHPPIPIPVVSVQKKPSPVVVVVSNNHNNNNNNNKAGPAHGTAISPSSSSQVDGSQVISNNNSNNNNNNNSSLTNGPVLYDIAGRQITTTPTDHQRRVSIHALGPRTQVIVRAGSEGSVVGLPGGGLLVRTGAADNHAGADAGLVRGGGGGAIRPLVGGRTPVRVVVAKPSAVASAGLNFSFSAAEDEVYPAFPVSPEDRVLQLAVPNGNQKDLHHGVLREKEPQSKDKDIRHGEYQTIKDSPIKDIKTTSRAVPSTSSTSTTITLSNPSSSSSITLENKENKPKARDLPMPRVPPTVCNEDIPPFYFPLGKPQTSTDVEDLVQKASAEFAKLEGGKAYKQQMGQIAKACGFPLYWRILLFRSAGGDKQGYLTLQSFSAMLKKLYSSCHDEASRFIRLLAKPGRMILEFDDLVPLVQDVVDGHPGLSFLQDAPEFHSRYVHTVISRIFFSVNRSWTGRITVAELRKSNFLQVLSRLEDEEDINQVTDFFSYEHFYVIYCKFWELDKDHDLYIDKADLARHNDHALNSRIIDRIFSGAVTRGKDFQEGRMSYKEFVWFLMAEEDKKHATSIEYWFRCMDMDGDGIISMYEMEFFYEEQMQKMEALGIEKLPFEDCLCQMFDLVRPRVEETITLSDLKKCRLANIFFDTFFNLDKFLDHEQRDPFANARDGDGTGNEISDWDRYAAEEYDILVAEEGINDQEEIFSRTFTRSHYEDDFEPDDDVIDDELARLVDSPQHRVTPRLHPASSDDIYDFSSNNLSF